MFKIKRNKMMANKVLYKCISMTLKITHYIELN